MNSLEKKSENNSPAAMIRRTFLKRSTFVLPLAIMPNVFPFIRTKEICVHRNIFAMGTTVSIQAYHTDVGLMHTAINKAFDDLRLMDSLFSLYDPQSEISRINKAAGFSDISVSRQTMELLGKAIQFSMLTDSIFDCTVEPLMKLWGFRGSRRSMKHPPTEKELLQTLEAVGYKNISIDYRSNKIGLLKEGGSIDLGGIAVGFSIDRMREILINEGIETALINHSGDIFAIGAPPGSSGWKIGIPSLHDPNEFAHTLLLKDRAISTSASNEKYFIFDGKKYSHIIDPKNGNSSQKNMTVSVITQSSVNADVYSTTLFCNENNALLEEKNGTKLEALYINYDGIIQRITKN